MKHCNKELKIQSGKSNGKEMFYAECEVCGLQHKDEVKKNVEDYFIRLSHPQNSINSNCYNNTLPAKLQPPKDKNTIAKWANDNMPALINQSAQFIDKPATSRMIEKNIRYVSSLSGAAWDKVWNTTEGQESISDGLADALYHGATLGDMGDLVPYGSSCGFIANIECYKHALENGKNSPFKDIQIICIYQNDQILENEIDNGNMKFSYKPGLPRGEIIAVVVMGIRTDLNKNVGEIYDADRLVEKAKVHSPSYKSFLIEKESFQRMKTEGKLLSDETGREYYINPIKKKDGTIWEKKIYREDLTNPYEGPDRPEMLRKSAGKSYFGPWMKTRNAVAMADEWNEDESVNDDASREQSADDVLNRAASQFETTTQQPIQDAEIIPEPQKNKSHEKTEAGEKPLEKKVFTEDDVSINKL